MTRNLRFAYVPDVNYSIFEEVTIENAEYDQKSSGFWFKPHSSDVTIKFKANTQDKMKKLHPYDTGKVGTLGFTSPIKGLPLCG